ncbi:Uma2 family endonuclease [Nonomuraea sp. NPDC050536]|uniref:Uma2 family endonuclease n=1 Tax=Nonomuraea sp. NPDC050536 TaxID=3364366 RepID=UPI0037CA6C93
MVAASRKTHACPTPDPQPEVSATTTPPADRGEAELTTLRQVYDFLADHTKLRIEIINERLIVSPSPTPLHQRVSGHLYAKLLPIATEHGWVAYPGVSICLDGTREPYEPDLVIAPPDAPTWGEREIFASGVIMVGEIVSRSSMADDRTHKPDIYASARIPIYLLVDPIADPQAVTVFSEPKEGQYTVSTTVAMGKEIHIPAPVDFLLDTSVFL